MNEVQRVIKYCAIAFAIILSVTIISAIARVAFSVAHAVSGGNVEIGRWSKKTIDVSKTFTGVESLNVDNSTGELKIQTGEEFKVEANNVSEDFEARVSGGKLIIKDRGIGIHFRWFHIDGSRNPKSKITLYIPEGFKAVEAKIGTGAGNVSVENLQADELSINAGAGNIEGSNLTADDVKIDGGVGSVKLSNVNFSDADFDCGVGNLNIDGVLLGKTKIDGGVGDIDVSLKGNAEDYGVDADSGVGTVRVNGEKVSDEHHYNSDAPNIIKVDGGVGSVRIDIKE